MDRGQIQNEHYPIIGVQPAIHLLVWEYHLSRLIWDSTWPIGCSDLPIFLIPPFGRILFTHLAYFYSPIWLSVTHGNRNRVLKNKSDFYAFHSFIRIPLELSGTAGLVPPVGVAARTADEYRRAAR